MKSMKPDILQLHDFYLTKLNIKWIEAEEKIEGFTFTIDYDIARNVDNNNVFKLALKYNICPKLSKISESKCSGYEIESEIVGIFYFPEGFEEDDIQLIIRDNGCRILYGILRGEIASITGSFPHGKFILPTVNMRKIVIDVEKNRIKEIGASFKKKLPKKPLLKNPQRTKKRKHTDISINPKNVNK